MEVKAGLPQSSTRRVPDSLRHREAQEEVVTQANQWASQVGIQHHLLGKGHLQVRREPVSGAAPLLALEQAQRGQEEEPQRLAARWESLHRWAPAGRRRWPLGNGLHRVQTLLLCALGGRGSAHQTQLGGKVAKQKAQPTLWL